MSQKESLSETGPDHSLDMTAFGRYDLAECKTVVHGQKTALGWHV